MNAKLERTHRMLATPKTNDGRYYFHPILMIHAATQYGKTYSEFMNDYHILVESNMKLLEMYDHDAVSVISDPNRETAAFGAKITFDGDSSPKADKLITCMEDVEKLEIPDVYAYPRTLDRINGVKLFREKLGVPFPIIGWVEGPLAECADLCGISELMMNMIMEPDMVKAHILSSLAQTDLDILDADWMVDVAEVHQVMGEGVMVCGNLDPVTVVMDGTRELIKAKYEEVKSSIPRENWIMMAGCEIPRDTPVENMKYLREISLS